MKQPVFRFEDGGTIYRLPFDTQEVFCRVHSWGIVVSLSCLVYEDVACARCTVQNYEWMINNSVGSVPNSHPTAKTVIALREPR